MARHFWLLSALLIAIPLSLSAQPAAQARFDPHVVGPYADSMVTLVRGIPRGWHTYSLTRDGPGFRYVESYDLTGFGHRQVEVSFTPRLVVLRASAHGGEMGDSSGADVRFAGRHATGWALVRRAGHMERAPVDTLLPAGAFDGYALMALIPALHLAPDTTIALTLFDADENSITTQSLHVGAVQQVSVPAGTFSAYRVDLSTTEAPVVLWYTTSTPHTLVRIGEPAGDFLDVLVSHRIAAQ